MKARPAFTLTEMVAVMAVMSVALALLTLTTVGALRLNRACVKALDRLGARQALADQFRADVARAVEAPARWRDDEAGPTCLLLGLGENHTIRYRWEANRLERAEFGGEQTHRRPIAIGDAAAVIEFRRSDSKSRLLTLWLCALRPDGSKERPVEITASLGGNLQ